MPDQPVTSQPEAVPIPEDDEEYCLRAIHSAFRFQPSIKSGLINTRWKDSIDIDHVSPNGRDFINKVRKPLVDRIASLESRLRSANESLGAEIERGRAMTAEISRLQDDVKELSHVPCPTCPRCGWYTCDHSESSIEPQEDNAGSLFIGSEELKRRTT